MPDIVRLRYLGALPVTVPAIGREVESEHLAEFPGKVLTEHPKNNPNDPDEKARPVPEDAGYILIESGGQVRAWPTTLWRNETPVSRAKSKE